MTTPGSTKKIKLVIADDHQMFIEGLRHLLTSAPDIEIIGQADNGASLLELIEALQPDIALADVSMPGPDLALIIKEVNAMAINCRVIALTMHLERSFALSLIEQGLSGYVTKDAVFSELLAAIKTVVSGQTYLCRQVVELPQTRVETSGMLTPRELQCIKRAAKGMTNKAIALELDISDRTVKFHFENICKKLSAERRGEAVAKARSLGIIS